MTDAQGGIRRFLHDGDDLVLEYGPTGTVLARHLHGLGSGDDPLISYTGANASYLDAEYLYTDRLGSVIARYRRDGTPAAINGYDEYGVPGPSSGVNNNGRFRFTGQVWLPELGLYYYKARMYSPTIGRFMQTDPIGYADGMNMYAYVGNDPVNAVDPTGLQEIRVIGPRQLPHVENKSRSPAFGWGFGGSSASGYSNRDRLAELAAEEIVVQATKPKPPKVTSGPLPGALAAPQNVPCSWAPLTGTDAQLADEIQRSKFFHVAARLAIRRTEQTGNEHFFFIVRATDGGFGVSNVHEGNSENTGRYDQIL